MRVNILSPYRKGGPYTWAENLVRELNKDNIRARHIHKVPELLASPFYQDCDMVHTAVPLSFTLWNKPVLLTIHGDYRREKNVWSVLYPLAIKKADRVTVPSHFLKKELGLENALVIPNGVNPARFTENKPFPKDHLKFVTVTNFNFEGKIKGVEILIGILEKFRQRNQVDFTLTIVGGGHSLERMKKRHADKSYVHFTGFSENVGSFLLEADLFLYYSFEDSFGIAVLEAMAHGLPVVSNNYGAITEIITPGREGYVSENEDNFLNTLERVVGCPEELSSTRKQAFKRITDSFSWERISGLYKECYESVTPRRS